MLWLNLLAISSLHLLPGFALLKWCWRGSTLSIAEQVAFALGIGVALPPLLLEFAHLIQLPWSEATTYLYLAFAALALAAAIARQRRQHHGPIRMCWEDALLLAMFVSGLAVRLYMVRDLPAGLWGDSYHHTLMTQLLVDHQGLFSSWEPYAPLASMTYHYGFHANVAFLHWLTGIPPAQGVLFVGQWLNALTVPMAYLLTVRVLRGGEHARVAGLCAALFTGFVNTQPAYYVNWGRYTQLAGQVVLPVVLIAWSEFARELASEGRPAVSARLGALSAILTTCLILTHYIIAIFGALFVAGYLVVLALARPGVRSWLRLGVGSGLVLLAALLLAAPWLANTLTGHLANNAAAFVNGAAGAQRIEEYSTLPPLTPFYLKDFMLWLAAAGLIFALWRRDWHAGLFALWTAAVVFTVRPQALGLPGAGIVDSFAASLALYVTLIPLSAYPLGLLFSARRSVAGPALDRFAPLALALFVGAVVLWGICWEKDLVDTNDELLTWADVRAMDWIRSHTPPDAQFLVSSFPAFGGSLIAGSDGGWWLPYLTGRKSNLPPITYGSEQWEDPDYYRRVNSLAEALRGKALVNPESVAIDLTQAESLATLRQAGIQYIYHGAHANPPPGQADYIDMQRLRQSSAFRLVYALDGVEIFQIVNPE